MVHVFVLMLYIGVGNERTLASGDMYFYSVHDCNYFAEHLSKRYGYRIANEKDLGVAYCVPRLVDPKKVTIY